MTTARLKTFADGVFAIAATLLIIDVGLPEKLHGRSAGSFLDIWPQYAAYAISFATIGIMWVNHHIVLVQVARVDRLFLFLNLGLLLSTRSSVSWRSSTWSRARFSAGHAATSVPPTRAEEGIGRDVRCADGNIWIGYLVIDSH
jgi:Endosomal/lysosomal potassium channel TMEM175